MGMLGLGLPAVLALRLPQTAGRARPALPVRQGLLSGSAAPDLALPFSRHGTMVGDAPKLGGHAAWFLYGFGRAAGALSAGTSVRRAPGGIE